MYKRNHTFSKLADATNLEEFIIVIDTREAKDLIQAYQGKKYDGNSNFTLKIKRIYKLTPYGAPVSIYSYYFHRFVTINRDNFNRCKRFLGL